MRTDRELLELAAKAEVDRIEREREAAERKQQEEWQGLLDAYKKRKEALAFPDVAAELRRLAAVEAELVSTKKALALVQQHHATAWNRGHEAGMRASRDIVKQATDAVAQDKWGNTQLTEALLAAEVERDSLAAEVERLREDAERYRWLRNGSNVQAASLVGENGDDALDAAIDAARGKG